MRNFSLFIVFLIGLCASGCAQKLHADISPGIEPTSLQSFYVAHFEPDKRDLHLTIKEQLEEMGFTATAGELNNNPQDVDAIVTYVDNWQWDLTNYMIKIQITFRDLKGSLLASATSFRTSLVRKSPPEMIRETLNEIFAPEKNKQ